jgi:hypothetical protein
MKQRRPNMQHARDEEIRYLPDIAGRVEFLQSVVSNSWQEESLCFWDFV